MKSDHGNEPVGRPRDSADAVDRVVGAVYDELRAVAARHLQNERPDHTLQPTALVHEAYVRMAQQSRLEWESHAHFVNIAAAQIRRILVDHARRRGRLKRGGNLLRVTLIDSTPAEAPTFDMIALNEALDRLNGESPEDRQIIELKYFGGLKEAEISTLMGISERTVRRRWRFARAWLFKELSEE